MKRLDNRQSKRVALQVRVRILGEAGLKGGFRELAHTLNVNLNGALVAMRTPVELGQRIRLLHGTTGEEQECRVAYVGPAGEGIIKVGLAFRNPAPHFWQIDFPPLQSPPPRQAVAPRAFAARRGMR